jgi:hypothetical protein
MRQQKSLLLATALCAVMGVNAQAQVLCLGERLVVAERTVHAGVVTTVTVQACGYHNLASAVADAFATAVDELNRTQAVLVSADRLNAAGGPTVTVLRIDYPRPVELVKLWSGFHTDPWCPVGLTPAPGCSSALGPQAFIK